MPISNFGIFAAPDRRLIFGLNDFDETLPGPFEWDLKRLVASFAVAGRDRGFDDGLRERVNRTVTRAYRTAIQQFAAMPNLDVWYARVDVDEVVARARANATQRKAVAKGLAKARAKDNLKALGKLTAVGDGGP